MDTRNSTLLATSTVSQHVGRTSHPGRIELEYVGFRDKAHIVRPGPAYLTALEAWLDPNHHSFVFS